MVDSGATGNSYDLKFATKMGLKAILKFKSEAVRAVEGTNLSSGPIVSHTEPVELISSEGHREVIQFNLINAHSFRAYWDYFGKQNTFPP